MSHNKIKVGGQSPNTSGEISVALDNLSNVSASSPSESDILQYSSGSWSTAALASVSSAAEYILVGQGESNDYSNSTTDTTISNGDILNFYDTAPKNTISGASIVNYLATDWITGITLPAGEYWILTTFRVEFSASGLLGFRWKTDAGGNLSNIAYIGENFSSVAGTSSTISSVINLASSDTIELNASSVSNVDFITAGDGSHPQGNTPSEFSSVLILKLE